MADLNLSGGKGDGGLRLQSEPAVRPSEVNPIQAAMPDTIKVDPLVDFSNDAVGSVGNIIGAAAAGFLGDLGFSDRQRQQRRLDAQMKRQNLDKGNAFAKNLLVGGKGLTGDQREKYRTSATAAIAKLGIPELADMFEANYDQPEMVTAFTELVDKTPMAQQFLSQDPSGESWLKFKSSTEGRAFVEQTADATYLEPGQGKVNGITSSLDKMARSGDIDAKLLERVQKDGKVSIPELRELSSSIPEGHPLKMSEEELSTVTATRNTEVLRSMGISLAEDFEQEDLKGSGNTVINQSGDIVGTLVNTDSGGNMVQPPGGGEPRPFGQGEYVNKFGDTAEAAGLGKKTQSEREDAIISADATLDQIAKTMDTFNPDFMTYAGKLKQFSLKQMEKVGIDLNEQDQKYLGEYTRFTQNSIDMLNRYINEITGAAIGAGQEEERLRQGIPDAQNMSPTQFMNAIENKMQSLQVERWRAAETIERGIPLTRMSLTEVENKIKDGSLIDKAAQRIIDRNPEITQADLVKRVQGMFPKDMYNEALQRRKKARGK